MEKGNKVQLKYIFMLQLLLFFLSFSSVCIKVAASHPALSFYWILFYGMGIVILGVYAILWQQILKKLPLTVAFCNKSVGIVWSMLWGSVLFQEQITLKMVIGAAVVLVGVILVVTANE